MKKIKQIRIVDWKKQL